METSRDTHVVVNGLLSQQRKVLLKVISSVMENVHLKDRLLLVLILALSTFLRFYQFPSLPMGLQPNEVNAAYQSYALLLHGTDLWGNRFPIYFPGSGSGQSVLLSYLNMPFIKIFGLTTFGVRFSSALLGVLTIVIFYAFIKKWYRTRTALIAAFLLGTNPWHIMLSRWSLDANLLPCFVLLGIAWLSYCYTSKYARFLIPFSLFLLALAFYAYAVAIVIIPTFLVLYFGLVGLGTLRRNKENMWSNKRPVMFSFVIFFLVASPFFLFILNNFILHTTPWIVQHLPFSAPLLSRSGLTQITGGQNILASNVQFLLSGLNDGNVWNMAGGYLPLGLLSFPLVALGIYYSIRTRHVHANLFLIWLVATIPLFFLIALNITRANALFLPLIALSAIGLSGIYDSLDNKKGNDESETPASDDQTDPEEFPTYSRAMPPKVAVVSMVLVALSIYNGFFCYSYFTTYNNDIKASSLTGFDTVLMEARSSASANEPIYVSDQIPFNYVYTLFVLKTDPLDFQKHSRVIASDGTYQALHYRNYYFSSHDPYFTSASSFVALLKGNDGLLCGYRYLVYSQGDWSVEQCFNGFSQEGQADE